MTEIIGIGMVMILPMIGIGLSLYLSWVYTQNIGKEIGDEDEDLR